ncbi:phosphoribosylglycinamide formyltransferase [Candidatus Saccharibacteria bacterium]|nr:phosphoribosylglycinamide formyltransferase [Candidatus Saccharibacteria bacterium]
MKNIAIFASGGGTNAERVIKQFQDSIDAHVAVVLTNNERAGVVQRADALDVPVEIIDKSWQSAEDLLTVLRAYDTDVILLLGYLKLMPEEVTAEYDGHIVNLHPALLPKYGGKGMYGQKVHKAVADNKDTESGFSLHRASSEYDKGEILYQAKVQISDSHQTAQNVEKLVLKLESSKVASAIAELIKEDKI